MSRLVNYTLPYKGETWMDGVLLSTSYPTGLIYSEHRDKITKGQTDIWDGFRYLNPYWMTFTRDVRPYGTWKVSYLGRVYEYKYCLSSLANFVDWPYRYLPEVPSYAENQALIKALTELKDQKVNLAVALAEASQVADLMATNANRIIEGIRAIKRGQWKRAFRKLRHQPRKGWDKELASRVLEFQYGVRPLIADIYGSMEALANAQYGPGRVGKPFKVRASIKSGDGTSIAWERDGGGYLPVNGFTSQKWEVAVVLWFSPKNELLKSPSELGMTNPLAVGWELLPFSCIVDWVYPAGDWLNTLDAALGLEFRGGCTTTWRSTRSDYRGRKTPTNGISSLRGSYEQRSMNRIVYSSLPYPAPPRVKNPVSLEHALNALALLASFRDDRVIRRYS